MRAAAAARRRREPNAAAALVAEVLGGRAGRPLPHTVAAALEQLRATPSPSSR